MGGVDARSRGHDEPDVAKQLCLISKLKLFCSELQRYTPHLVAPGIVGVVHLPIPKTTASDSGFVVTFVPKSEANTHMAMGKNQRRFYYRSGDSFLPMEAFMVADRFGRRARPQLELDCRLEPGSSSGRKIGIRIVIGIKNIGQGIALYPAVVIQETPSLRLDRYGLDGNGKTGIPERRRTSSRPQEAYRFFAGGTDDAIHPGTTLDVTCVSHNVFREQENYPDLNIKYDLYCEGYANSGEASVPIKQFVQKLL